MFELGNLKLLYVYIYIVLLLLTGIMNEVLYLHTTNVGLIVVQ
jgi:hypothetical protein